MGRIDIYMDGKKTQFSSENQPSKNGRKPKSFRMFNDKMKEEGYEPLTKEELIGFYSLIFSADEEKIQEVANDSTQPLALRLLIQEMTDERTRSRALVDFRDYMFGKAKEEIKLEAQIETVRIFEIPDNGRGDN
jgi:hypothetical protein